MICQLQLWDWISIILFFKRKTIKSNEQDIGYLQPPTSPFGSSPNYTALFTYSPANRILLCHNQPFHPHGSRSTLQMWTRKHILSALPVYSTGVLIPFHPSHFQPLGRTCAVISTFTSSYSAHIRLRTNQIKDIHMTRSHCKNSKIWKIKPVSIFSLKTTGHI